MSASRGELLERAFPPPEHAFELLLHRRRRKARTKRIAAAAVAMTVAVASISFLIGAFRQKVPPRPASGPPISIANVSRLGLAWSADAGSSILAPPVVAGDRVYVTAISGVALGYPIACGRTTQCRPSWKADTGAAFDTGSALVSDGAVMVGSSDGVLRSYPVSCGNVSRCSATWSASSDGSLEFSTPILSDGRVFVLSSSGRFSAFPTACSSPRCSSVWTDRLPGGSGGEFAVAAVAAAKGYVLVASNGGELKAFATSCVPATGTCTPVWSAKLPADTKVGIQISDGVAYVASGEDLEAFALTCAHDPCHPVWVGHLGETITGVAVSADRLYVGGFSGRVSVFTVGCGSQGATCRPIHRFHAGGARATPYLAGGVLFVAGGGGVRAYAPTCGDAGSGCQPIWTSPPMGSLSTQVAVADGTLFVGSGDDHLYAFQVGADTPTTASVEPPGSSRSSSTGYAIFYGALVAGGATWLITRRRRRATAPRSGRS